MEVKYPQSGLYRNDGSTDLIWPSHYITTCREVFVANDGRHVVAAKSIDSTCWDGDEPYVFYASGKKIAGHDDYATLPCIWMRYVIGEWVGIELPYEVRMAVDDDAGAFIVETNQFDTLKFELATGQFVSRRSPWPYFLAALAIGPPVGLWAWRRRIRRANTATAGARQVIGFSIRETLALTALVAGTLAAARLWGNIAAACSIIATAGALTARIRAGTTSAWFVGAVAALYAACMSLLVSAMIDNAMLGGFTLLRLWLDEDSSKWAPIGTLGVAALAASWFTSRMCAASSVAEL
jgi:hypothetical protein